MLRIEVLRAARGLLGWSQSELAARAGPSLPTVKRVEAGSERGRIFSTRRSMLWWPCFWEGITKRSQLPIGPSG